MTETKTKSPVRRAVKAAYLGSAAMAAIATLTIGSAAATPLFCAAAAGLATAAIIRNALATVEAKA